MTPWLLLAALVASAPAEAATPVDDLASRAKAAADARDCGTAETLYAQAATLAEASDPARAVGIYSSLGGVLEMLGRGADAERAFGRGLLLAEKASKKPRDSMGALYYNLALLYQGRDKDRARKAQGLARKAAVEFKAADDQVSLGKAYMTEANALNDQDRDAEALTLYRRSRRVLERAKAYRELSDTCANLAFLLAHLKRPDSWDAYECALGAAQKAGPLADRRNRDLLQGFSDDLKAAGLSEKARPIDATIARIDALPAPSVTSCKDYGSH